MIGCAEGILDWGTSWYPQINKVTVEVTFDSKDAAAAFADEMGNRFKGNVQAH